jgi:hypothetical protein
MPDSSTTHSLLAGIEADIRKQLQELTEAFNTYHLHNPRESIGYRKFATQFQRLHETYHQRLVVCILDGDNVRNPKDFFSDTLKDYVPKQDAEHLRSIHSSIDTISKSAQNYANRERLTFAQWIYSSISSEIDFPSPHYSSPLILPKTSNTRHTAVSHSASPTPPIFQPFPATSAPGATDLPTIATEATSKLRWAQNTLSIYKITPQIKSSKYTELAEHLESLNATYHSQLINHIRLSDSFQNRSDFYSKTLKQLFSSEETASLVQLHTRITHCSEVIEKIANQLETKECKAQASSESAALDALWLLRNPPPLTTHSSVQTSHQAPRR